MKIYNIILGVLSRYLHEHNGYGWSYFYEFMHWNNIYVQLSLLNRLYLQMFIIPLYFPSIYKIYLHDQNNIT